MVRSDAQRRLLYEMDMAITALRRQDLAQNSELGGSPVKGERPEVVTLTGCYHNLLRMWADV
jgi:PKHD-type hydroxylase